MKRFLLFCCIFCLTLSLCVPVFAESSDSLITGYTLSGQWIFNEVLSYPEYVPVPDLKESVTIQSVNFDCAGAQCGSFMIIRGQTEVSLFFGYDGQARYTFTDNGWWSSSSRRIDFGDTPQLVDKEFYLWFMANALPLTCDASTCTMSDSNLDYICDDCSYPIPFEHRVYTYSETVIFRTADSKFLKVEYVSNKPISIRGYVDSSNYRVDSEFPVWVRAYSSPNNADWELLYSTDISSHCPSCDLDDEVISSTFNWYTSSSGDLFFPLPLWVTVSNNSQGSLPLLSREVGGTMTTLALCGVGLVALLMVLNLFGKTLPIFRRK